MKTKKKNIENHEQLKIPTLGFASANVTLSGRFMQSETKHKALYYLFLRDGVIELVWGEGGEGGLVEDMCRKVDVRPSI